MMTCQTLCSVVPIIVLSGLYAQCSQRQMKTGVTVTLVNTVVHLLYALCVFPVEFIDSAVLLTSAK